MKKIQILILLIIIFIFGACSKYDYTLRKPVVKFKTPSKKALSIMLRETNGKRYRWAEEGPNSFDCSGFTYYSYGSMNLWLPRRAIEQSRYGKTVSINNLRYGDLIFFDTRRYSRGKINHVGIYIGNNRFRHASSKKKRIITTSLKKPYYKKRVVICKRVIPTRKYTKPKPKPKQKARVKVVVPNFEKSIIKENPSLEKCIPVEADTYIDRPLMDIDINNTKPIEESTPQSYISKTVSVVESNSSSQVNF